MSETKQLTVTDQIKNTLQAMGPQFEAALPTHISVKKFTRVAQTAVLGNQDLLKCDRTSLYKACIESAQDSLLPDGREAAFVPFKGQVKYMPMVAGVLKKVRNSGELSSLAAQIVHQNDKFSYWVDEDGEHIKHEPDFLKDRGDAVAVYAVAKTKDDGVYIEVLTKKDVEAIKGSSRSKSGPWSGPFYLEMWKKSAIRRLAKRLPMSTDLEQTIRRDDDMYEFEDNKPQEPVNVEAKVKDRLESMVAPAVEKNAVVEGEVV